MPTAAAILAAAGGNLSPTAPGLTLAAAGGNLSPTAPGLTGAVAGGNLDPNTPEGTAPNANVLDAFVMAQTTAGENYAAVIYHVSGAPITVVMPTLGVANASLSVTWNAGTRVLTINRAANGSGVFTSTTTQVVAAVTAAVSSGICMCYSSSSVGLVTWGGGTIQISSAAVGPAPLAPAALTAAGGANLAPAAPGLTGAVAGGNLSPAVPMRAVDFTAPGPRDWRYEIYKPLDYDAMCVVFEIVDRLGAISVVCPARAANSALSVTWNSGTRTLTINRSTDSGGGYVSWAAQIASAILAQVPQSVMIASYMDGSGLTVKPGTGNFQFGAAPATTAPAAIATAGGANLAPTAPGAIV